MPYGASVSLKPEPRAPARLPLKKTPLAEAAGQVLSIESKPTMASLWVEAQLTLLASESSDWSVSTGCALR